MQNIVICCNVVIPISPMVALSRGVGRCGNREPRARVRSASLAAPRASYGRIEGRIDARALRCRSRFSVESARVYTSVYLPVTTQIFDVM